MTSELKIPVIGIGADGDIVKVCQKALVGIETQQFPDKCYLPIEGERLLSTPSHWAYLKIAEGCDNRCAYCAIPSIRGRFRSRSIESVVNEAKKLADRGVKEVILVAQDTTKYGEDIYGEYKLDELLKQLVKIDRIEWIRLFYCYPHRITDSLIDVIASEDKICKYIDIPLQHADKDILRTMNRVGDSASYKALIDKMRSRIKGLSLRTTFMVGFPGETEEQFNNLCEFVKDVKERRCEVLMDIQYGITENSNKSRIGNCYKVIVDSFEDGKYIGRSYMDSPEIDSGIIFTSERGLKIGDFCEVVISGYDGYDLTGEVVIDESAE